jgi:hypothetical protein
MNKDKDYYILVDAGLEWLSLENGVIWIRVRENPEISYFKMVSTLGNSSTNHYRNKPANFSNFRMQKI